jgi:hypothetical protein
MDFLGFGEDEQGELYIAAIDPSGSLPNGRVLKINSSP